VHCDIVFSLWSDEATMKIATLRRAAERHHEITSERAGRLAEMLRAVAHPLRLRIIALLCGQETNVNTLAERLPAAQAIVSQHLRILRMSRLVEVTRAGGEARYRLAEPHLVDLIRCVESCDHD
jgi:ArsR family transcriptional regulator